MEMEVVNLKVKKGFIYDVEKPDFVKVNIFSKKGKNGIKYLAKAFLEDSLIDEKDVLIVEFLVTEYSHLIPGNKPQPLKIPYGIIVKVTDYSVDGIIEAILHHDAKGRPCLITIYSYTEKIIDPPTDGKSLDLYINAVLEER